MATQQLDVILAAKNQTDAAFLKLNSSLKTSEIQIATTTDRAARFAQGLGQVSTTLARSASATGLYVPALRAIDDAADVAAIGLQGLSKAAIGFNAATLGVVGAGLGVGTLIGGWLRDIPAVSRTMDGLANSLFGVAEASKLSANEQKKLNEEVFKQKDALIKQEYERLRATGMSAAAIKQYLADETKGYETATEMLGRWTDEERKKEEATKKAAAEAKKAAEEQAEAVKRAIDLQVEATNYFEKEAAESWEAVKKAAIEANEFVARDTAEKYDAMQKKVAEFAEEGIRKIREKEEKEREELEKTMEQYGRMRDVLGLVGQAFDAFGLRANEALTGLMGAGESAIAVFERLATGDIWGAIMAGIRGVISLIGGLKSVLGGFFDWLFGGGGGPGPVYPNPANPKPTNPLPDDFPPPGGGGLGFAGPGAGFSGFMGGEPIVVNAMLNVDGRVLARSTSRSLRKRQVRGLRLQPGRY